MTAEAREKEARDAVIAAAHFAIWWWTSQVQDVSLEDRISGAVHTFLAELDGVGQGPACDVVVLESDQETGATVGETRVSTMLHEFLYPLPTEGKTE